mgnify:CR=1 FL=1
MIHGGRAKPGYVWLHDDLLSDDATRARLTGWALDGRGIVMKPVFEVAEYLRDGRLVPVATATPPVPTQLSCLSQHRRFRDPKIRLFSDFISAHIREALRRATEGLELAG